MKDKVRFKRWKPYLGERFYYISQRGTISSTRAGCGEDTVYKIATGNCFKSYSLASKVLKRHLLEIGLPFAPFGKIEFCLNSDRNFYKAEKFYPKANLENK